MSFFSEQTLSTEERKKERKKENEFKRMRVA
jgi:hypothetical protein